MNFIHSTTNPSSAPRIMNPTIMNPHQSPRPFPPARWLRRAVLALLSSFILHPSSFAQSASPSLIPFQGRLTDQQGQAYGNNQYTLTFNLYDQAVGGNTVWTERHEKVSVINGMVNVFLGSVAGIGNVNFATTKYLGITVDADDNPATPDPEMVPRTMIIPAFHAKNTDKLAGHDWSAILEGGSNNPLQAYLRGDRISQGSITSAQIVDGTITFADLQPGIVDSLSGSLVQSAPVPSFTATEDIAALDAVAVTTDIGGITRILKAGRNEAIRSRFYGFAKAAAATGQPVTVQQYGPLAGFSGLITGQSYFLSTQSGSITANGGVVPIYVGHALSPEVLFVDVFGVSKTWGGSNYWGDGSDGELNTVGNVSFPVATDGEVVVKQYTSVTINAGHSVTTQNRCRGLVIYVNGDCVINGTLSMTAKGASVNPVAIPSTGIRLIRVKTDGPGQSMPESDLGFDGAGEVGSLWKSVEAFQRGAVGNGKIYTIAKVGGGGGGATHNNSFASLDNGGAGGVHPEGTGGGGGGGASGGWSGTGGAGTCYSGGSGGGGFSGNEYNGNGQNGSSTGGPGGNGVHVGHATGTFGTAGGGAGNPGGGAGNSGGEVGQPGTGGLLVLLVRGNLMIGPSASVESKGSNGGVAKASGGSSGGGRIIVLHAGNYNAAVAPSAAGGPSVGPQARGGAGGAGAVTIDRINP
jgi:hypothetical protein